MEFIPALYGRQVEQLSVKSCPLSNSCSPSTLRSYFVASMPFLTEFNDEEVTAQDRALAEALLGPLLKAQRTQDQQRLHFATTITGTTPAPATVAVHGGRYPGKGVHGSLLRAVQQQAQAVSKHPTQATASVLTAGDSTAHLPPFMAPTQHSIGSASQEAMRQSLTNSSEPTTGSSGLSQRALQRRCQYVRFCAAFDDALGKIVLESVQEMKTISFL